MWGKVVRWLLNMIGDSVQMVFLPSEGTSDPPPWPIRTKLEDVCTPQTHYVLLWMLLKLSWGEESSTQGAWRAIKRQKSKICCVHTQTCERLLPPRLLRRRVSVIFVRPWSCPCIFWPAERATPELICYTSDVEHTHGSIWFAASLLATAQRGHVRLNQLK